MQDLSAINLSLAGYTPVDLVAGSVADWSDGGRALRQRERGTSWYAEARPAGPWLGDYVDEATARTDTNAATGAYYHNTTDGLFYELLATSGQKEIFRGGSAEFPEEYVVLAEAGMVIIFDATDPALPMWMVFKGSYSWSSGTMLTVADGSNANITTAALYNGRLLVGSYDTVSTATGTTTYISLYTGAGALASETVTWDDVSCRLADSDRSVKNNGLQVFGSLTKAAVATGAELAAYSGFSVSNYLEQPYNADLDFGTGDFCVMGWVKDLGQWNTIVSRAVYGTTSSFWFESDNAGNARITLGSTYYYVPTPLSPGWALYGVIRKSGVLYTIKNGDIMGSSATAGENVSVIGATLTVGSGAGNPLGGADYLVGEIALLRISATAPSAEQIRHIYETEKVLFQEGAACTLYGSSDAVNALAHDPATGLLHVGTSAGRSTFNGLRRVANTTTGITTAISARNDMIVEA